MTHIPTTAGAQLLETALHFSRDSLVRYAGASGDFNPIHYRDDIAAEVGLPGVLAHGMLTMGAAIQPLVDLLGDPGRVREYSVRFSRAVVVDPDTGVDVRVVATVAEEPDEHGIARIDLTVQVDDDTVLTKAQVRAQLA